MAEIKTPVFVGLKEATEANLLRKECEAYLENDCKGELKLVKLNEVVARWASQAKQWNVECEGITLAESWLVALCYQRMATHPPSCSLEAYDCIALYDTLQNQCRRPGDADLVSELFDQLSFLVVYILSHGLDDAAKIAADTHYRTRAPESQMALEDDKALSKLTQSEALAGRAVLGLIPMASRFFWHAWVEQTLQHNAEDAKCPKESLGKFQKWLEAQFRLPTQQSFRVALTELVLRDRLPMGAELFHQRGSALTAEVLPAMAMIPMELAEEEQKIINEALDASIPEMESQKSHLAREMAILHMWMYTFANRLATTSKKTVFDPFVVFKGDTPARLAELTGPVTQWGRPRRPVIVQTHSGLYLHSVCCTCQPDAVTADHKEGATSCVLRRRVTRCSNMSEAITMWLLVMHRDFRDHMADGTSVSRVTSEVFA